MKKSIKLNRTKSISTRNQNIFTVRFKGKKSYLDHKLNFILNNFSYLAVNRVKAERTGCLPRKLNQKIVSTIIDRTRFLSFTHLIKNYCIFPQTAFLDSVVNTPISSSLLEASWFKSIFIKRRRVHV